MSLSRKAMVVVVEDQPDIREDIVMLVSRQPGLVVVGAYGSVQEAAREIPALQPQVLLLDVDLGNETAFDLLARIPTDSYKIIFVTAYQEHAIHAFRVGALDYLLKPVEEQELVRALYRALPVQSEQVQLAHQQFIHQRPPGRLALFSQQFIHIVELDEVAYCQSVSGYTTFYMKDERKILTSKYIKEFEELLPAHLFIRPHQSYIVNNQFIDRYHKDGYLILRNGTEIPVATRRKDYILHFLNNI